jgi:hypothetical protein
VLRGHENELAGSPLIPRQSETRLRLPEAGFAFQRDSSSVPRSRAASKTSRPRAVAAAPAEIVTTTVSRASVLGSSDSTIPWSRDRNRAQSEAYVRLRERWRQPLPG